MMPIGPAPVMSTSSPTRLNDSAVCVALPNGSKIAAISSGMSSGILNALNAGITRYSANAPSRLTPTPTVLRQRWRRPGAAVAAEAAGDVAFSGDAVADREAAHFLPELDDFAHVFVADVHRHGNRLLRPVVPLPDMDVGAADRGLRDPDHHVVVADFRLFHARERQPRRAFQLGKHFHGDIRFIHCTTPSARPTRPNAAIARSTCAVVWAALIWVRIRALPFGTTGYEKPMT